MYSENRLGNGKRGGRLTYLTLIAVLASAAFGLSACGNPEKENLPGTQPSPSQSQTQSEGQAQMVKPKITGVKLTPKASTASRSEAGADPPRAIDGNLTTRWSAGDTVPQWIQIDLGEPTTISTVLLDVAQFPAGPTSHQVYGGPTPDNLKPLGTLDGNTTDDQWLTLSVTASDVRYLKVMTVKSPSWVSWKEIEVYK